MKALDFRGQEPTGFLSLSQYEAPYYVDTDRRIEYWHTGKLYRFRDEARIERFIHLLGIQNEIDNADVAVGPAYTFDDSDGYSLDVPILDLELGHIGIYHAVGDANANHQAKKDLYNIHAHDWDGVPQIPLTQIVAER